MLALGLDIGGTKINIGIIHSENGFVSPIATRRLAVKDVTDACNDIKSAVLGLCRENGINYEDIGTCGVGVPGTVSPDGKRLIKAPNISLLNASLADDLTAALGIPTVMLQDSRAAAWGEYKCGGGKGMSTVVCITLGTGIGTGIVIDGRIYNGALGSAGELGHLPVVENGRPCGCGKRGCLEKYCAGGGLDITAREMLGANKTAIDLFDAALKGNTEAQKAIRYAIGTLGNAIVATVNLLSPDCILFSGGMSERTQDLLEPLIEYVSSHCYTSGTLPRLEKARLGELAPLIGAALYPLSPKHTNNK